MSAGKPLSARFTVTPPNRSTLPLSSWEPTIELLKGRTLMRAGPEVLPHHRPVSVGRNLRLKRQEAIIVVAKLTLVLETGPPSTCPSCYVKLRLPSFVTTVIAQQRHRGA